MRCLQVRNAAGTAERSPLLLAQPAMKAGMVSTKAMFSFALATDLAPIEPEALAATYWRLCSRRQISEVTVSVGQDDAASMRHSI